MVGKNKKNSYAVFDEVLVEYSISARINLSDLEIYPEGMSISQIKSKLIKAFHEILEESDSIKVSSYDVTIHKDTATTRSVQMFADDEEIK